MGRRLRPDWMGLRWFNYRKQQWGFDRGFQKSHSMTANSLSTAIQVKKTQINTLIPRATFGLQALDLTHIKSDVNDSNLSSDLDDVRPYIFVMCWVEVRLIWSDFSNPRKWKKIIKKLSQSLGWSNTKHQNSNPHIFFFFFSLNGKNVWKEQDFERRDVTWCRGNPTEFYKEGIPRWKHDVRRVSTQSKHRDIIVVTMTILLHTYWPVNIHRNLVSGDVQWCWFFFSLPRIHCVVTSCFTVYFCVHFL